MFDGLMRVLTGGGQKSGPSAQGSEFAVALLLIEAARSDDKIDPRELNLIERALVRRFSLDQEQVALLIAAARKASEQADDIFRSTRTVVEKFTEAERIGVIEMLWEVAYADNVVTDDEDALIRLVAGLIYVSDRERGEARKRVQQRARR